ncbi:MAG: peptidylprolyl isomerase [Clostridia bacterium]
MKKIISAILAAGMMAAASNAALAGSDNITVILDGSTLAFDVQPQIINERTMVPMRVIFEALGATVEWNDEERKITSQRDDTVIEMTVDNPAIYVNGDEITLDTAPLIIDERTLVPARAVAESFNAEVEWYGDTRTVLILDKAKDSLVKAKVDIEKYGSVGLLLFENVAPKTVENFKQLAESEFYSGLLIHRVINNFMIQGGGYDQKLQIKDSPTIVGEFRSNGVDNNLSHTRGVISMARTMQSMDSASSQFFIMHKDSIALDGDYAAFGIVTDGMDVVDTIAGVNIGILPQLGMEDVPMNPIFIKSVTIE